MWIALFNVAGSFFAVDNTCPHAGGPIGEGHLTGEVVTCPWHGWEYDPATGSLEGDPKTHLDVYPIKVENGDVLVDV